MNPSPTFNPFQEPKQWILLVTLTLSLSVLAANLYAAENTYVQLKSFMATQAPSGLNVDLEYELNPNQSSDGIRLFKRIQPDTVWTELDVQFLPSKSNPNLFELQDENLSVGTVSYKLTERMHAMVSAGMEVALTLSLAEAQTASPPLKATAYPNLALVALQVNATAKTNYEVRRSLDGKNWEDIGRFSANDNHKHTFYDSNAPLGTLRYQVIPNGATDKRAIVETEITNGDLASMTNLSRTSRTMVNSFITQPSDNGRYMSLSWQADVHETLREFIVMHSSDKAHWTVIQTLKATNNALEFQTNHMTPVKGTNYYKLVWFDNDNAYAFASVSGGIQENLNRYQPFPNPAIDRLTIQTEEAIQIGEEVVVSGVHGEEYRIPAITVNNQPELDISSLPRGVYVVKLPAGFVRFQKD